MATDPIFFRDLAYVVVAAVLGGVLARLAHQPLILGYVAGGLLVSPLTPGPSVSDFRNFDAFAEIGVILLMFSIGIEFSLRDLLRVKWVAILGAPVGILTSIALVLGLGTLLGWSALQSLVLGMAVSVCSTMVLARLLQDRGELHSRHGRVMIGVSLVEDLAVVVLMVLIPRLGSLEPGRLLQIAGGLGLSVAILAPFLYLAAKAVPRLFTRIARLQNQELFLLVALGIALGTAAITHAVGLSLALGAFLAGLLISESDYAHETLSRLLPLRDVFVAVFFVTIGALLDARAVLSELGVLATVVGVVVVGNSLIWIAIVRLSGRPIWVALAAGVGLGQIGEFTFILIRVARDAGHVADGVYHATLAASLVTILVNAFLVRSVPPALGRTRLFGPGDLVTPPPEPSSPVPFVVLCGFGRVGSAVAEALETFGSRYSAIEFDPDVVRNLRLRGIPSWFGDAANRRLLEMAGVARADLVVVALPDIERAHLTVRAIRAMNPDVPILARAHHLPGHDRLVEAGATEVIQPELEAASTLIRHALRRLELPRDKVLAYLDRLRDAMDALAPPRVASDDLPEVRDTVLVGGDVVGQSLREAGIRERFGVTVIGVIRADGERIPHATADTVLRAGDRVRVFGLPGQISAFREATGAAGDGEPGKDEGAPAR
jgi:CPA2 family monovalent cation:H+ antiporter-2